MGLDWDLRQACVYRGLPPHLSEWFKAAIELDVGLREFRAKGDGTPAHMKIPTERPQLVKEGCPAKNIPKLADTARRPLFRCFRCNQTGHQVAECPMPAPRTPMQTSPLGIPARGRSKTMPERSQLTQTLVVSAEVQAREGTMAPSPGKFLVVSGDSDDDDPDDPMVSAPVCLFVIPIMIQNPRSATGLRYGPW